MPKPKQRRKPAKLPPGAGIHEIVLPSPDQTPTEAGADAALGAAHASDRILLEQLKTALEQQHGRPYSTSEVLRWALWHCPWDA